MCAGRRPPGSIYLRFFFFFFARSIKHSQSHSNHFPSTGGAIQDKMSAILLLNSAMSAAFSANRRTLSRLAIQTEQSRQDGELENMAELDSVRNGTLEMQQPPPFSRDIASGFDAQRPLTTPACTTTVVVNAANKETYKRSDYVNLEECYDETAWIRVCPRLTATSSDIIPVVVPLSAVTRTLPTFPPQSRPRETGRHATPILQKCCFSKPPPSSLNAREPSGPNEQVHSTRQGKTALREWKGSKKVHKARCRGRDDHARISVQSLWKTVPPQSGAISQAAPATTKKQPTPKVLHGKTVLPLIRRRLRRRLGDLRRRQGKGLVTPSSDFHRIRHFDGRTRRFPGTADYGR